MYTVSNYSTDIKQLILTVYKNKHVHTNSNMLLLTKLFYSLACTV